MPEIQHVLLSLRMRKNLTIGLFLILSWSAAAQLHRDIFRFPHPLYQAPDTVSIVFLGDMMMHSGQIANARTAEDTYDFSTCFSRVERLIKQADIAVANMEFTLAGRPYTGYPCFSAPDSYVEAIAESGVDIFLTANNHILDKGKGGIERTLGIYTKMEEEGRARHTGASLSAPDDSLRFPLKVACRGIRFAFINFTYGTNSRLKEEFPKVHRTDTAEIALAIRAAKESGADFIIALPHWGNEYVLKHSASQGRLARWLAEKGCDAVVGAHPHVLQDIENSDGRQRQRNRHTAGAGGIFIGQFHLEHERSPHAGRDDGDAPLHEGPARRQKHARSGSDADMVLAPGTSDQRLHHHPRKGICRQTRPVA